MCVRPTLGHWNDVVQLDPDGGSVPAHPQAQVPSAMLASVAIALIDRIPLLLPDPIHALPIFLPGVSGGFRCHGECPPGCSDWLFNGYSIPPTPRNVYPTKVPATAGPTVTTSERTAHSRSPCTPSRDRSTRVRRKRIE